MIQISHPVLQKTEIDGVVKVLKSGNLVQGPVVEELEKKVADFCGVRYAVAVSNGTAALHTALHAAGIKSGDEVIVPAFTFIATANAVLMAGAKPVFADILPDTYNLDPDKFEKAISAKTKAVIPVNLYGQPADYNRIMPIARKHNITVIEDAAQSLGAIQNSKKSGNLADIACFSLYATKNITSGEGGILTTNDKNVYTRAIYFRNHGQNPVKRYDYHGLGYNYRLTDFTAVIALEQLKRIDTVTKKRRENAKMYIESMQNFTGIILPETSVDNAHVFNQFTLRITKAAPFTRDKMRNLLENHGIQTVIYYPEPLYAVPHLRLKRNTDKLPETEKACSEVISIPVHVGLTKQNIQYIIRIIRMLYYHHG